MNPAKKPAWTLAVASLLGLTSAMALVVYLTSAPTETPTFDAVKGLLFWGEPGEPAMHAPPLINLSQINMLFAWAGLTALLALVCLWRAGTARDRYTQPQPRAVAVVVSLLTLFCLWHAWPFLRRLSQLAGLI
jgi:hypothetical protein